MLMNRSTRICLADADSERPKRCPVPEREKVRLTSAQITGGKVLEAASPRGDDGGGVRQGLLPLLPGIRSIPQTVTELATPIVGGFR